MTLDLPLPSALDPAIPADLADRIEPLSSGTPRPDGAFVLYWMRTAARAHENPALDTAIRVGNRLGRSVLVYHALSERYPYAADRHHTFILEGARDVQADCAARGIAYAFHLERPGQRGPVLKALAARAALVVTEDMPWTPMRRWARAVAVASCTPVWAVDTACVLPMRLVGKAFTRAFAFRKATEKARASLIGRSWPDPAPSLPARLPDDLGFEPVDLQSASIPDLVAACAIDHLVGPVAHTPGGSRSGYARWAGFRAERLAAYADRRTDALDRDGVSRLSAYLHYGQISPFRIAREATAETGKGAAKFLDELLVWRELAYGFCKYGPDPDSLAAVPDWARETLRAHESDARAASYDLETLARGKTGEPLWNAAQASLTIQGELHNNLRMTWGKEVVAWSPDAATALARLIDLNHRYALDGRDPNAYGGILWCLGQFDRPFPPGEPVFGTVRPRSARVHAQRLDVPAYDRQVRRPARRSDPRIAVIGGGIAGLTAARGLADHGLTVRGIDKGRGAGGRTATRRAEPFRFDHGAQYFTARDPRFRRFVDAWVDRGIVARWDGRVVAIGADGTLADKPGERFVGRPGMNAVARHLASDVDVAFGVEVDRLTRDGALWRLWDRRGEPIGDGFDRLVLACPAPQTARLLAPVAEPMAARVRQAEMAPCWTVMAGFGEPLPIPFDGAFGPAAGPLGWIARNGAKPGRPDGEAWVLQATPDWSARRLEVDRAAVAQALLAAFAEAAGPLPEPIHLDAHRWRYARPVAPLDQPCLFDPGTGLIACGDWCLAGRVEAAFLSGAAACGRLLGQV